MKRYILLAVIMILITYVESPNSRKSIHNIVVYNFNNIHVQLPQTTDIKENQIVDGELLSYNFYFEEKQLSIRGYIQSWNIQNVEEFLVFTKEQSTYDFSAYSLKPITVATLDGLLNEWTASFGKVDISGHEYWLRRDEDNNSFLRIAFLTNHKTFSEEQLSYIARVISSLQI